MVIILLLILLRMCRCDKLLFMTTAHHPDLPTVALNVSGPESYSLHWEKTA